MIVSLLQKTDQYTDIYTLHTHTASIPTYIHTHIHTYLLSSAIADDRIVASKTDQYTDIILPYNEPIPQPIGRDAMDKLGMYVCMYVCVYVFYLHTFNELLPHTLTHKYTHA
jgi:hypothetical protein